MARRTVTVFGGSGFIGRHLVQRLARAGAHVRVAVKDVEAAAFLKPLGDLGQIVPVKADVTDDASVAKAVDGADWVVNLVGLMHSSGKRSYRAVHAGGAERIAKAAKTAGATRLVHVSSLGAHLDSISAHLMTKAEGEKVVAAAFPDATILRPSIIFGPGDCFFNKFAGLIRISPVLPIFTNTLSFTSNGANFQPVYVGDVADAIMGALTGDSALGKTYELVGPRVMNMREAMGMIVKVTGRKRWILPIHVDIARFVAIFNQFWWSPWITPDQLTMLEIDSVASGDFPGLKELGVAHPETVETILPTYLSRFRLLHNCVRMRGDVSHG